MLWSISRGVHDRKMCVLDEVILKNLVHVPLCRNERLKSTGGRDNVQVFANINCNITKSKVLYDKRSRTCFNRSPQK